MGLGSSFAKTPQRLKPFPATCYTTPLYVVHFKRAHNSGEGHHGRLQLAGQQRCSDAPFKPSRAFCHIVAGPLEKTSLCLANCYAGCFHPFSPCECELSLCLHSFGQI
jgi:hypothetical protein